MSNRDTISQPALIIQFHVPSLVLWSYCVITKFSLMINTVVKMYLLDTCMTICVCSNLKRWYSTQSPRNCSKVHNSNTVGTNSQWQKEYATDNSRFCKDAVLRVILKKFLCSLNHKPPICICLATTRQALCIWGEGGPRSIGPTTFIHSFNGTGGHYTSYSVTVTSAYLQPQL